MNNNGTSDSPYEDQHVKYENDEEAMTVSALPSEKSSTDTGDTNSFVHGDEKEVLRKRAITLAQQAQSAQLDGETLDVVEFELAGERYAVAESLVGGVHTLTELIPIPCTPTFVMGVFRVRGHIFSAIDIREFLDLPRQGIADMSKVIVLHNENMELGIVVGSVLGVRRILLKDLQPDLSTLTGNQKDFFGGVTRDRLVVIDAERLLLDDRIIVHEEVRE
jgi:purine-binding chemotaxis protein CheW